MFFPHDILIKYPSLGQAWLAATIGNSNSCKKLTKSNVIQFNINEVCMFILSPPHPLSIRLSSQLMLGTVRILKYQINIVLNQCHQVHEYIHKSQYTLKATRLAETVLVTEQLHRLHRITLVENNDIYIGMQIDQLLGTKLFEQLEEVRKYKSPTPGPLSIAQSSAFTSPSIILDGDTLTLMERAGGTGEDPLGLEFDQDYEPVGIELPKSPSLQALPSPAQGKEFISSVILKREHTSKKVKLDEAVVYSHRDLFRTFEQVSEDTDRELEEYETKRKYRNELKEYLKLFTEPLIPLYITGEEEYLKNALNAAAPPIYTKHEASFAAPISPLADISSILSVGGQGSQIDIEENRRGIELSPMRPTMEMPWNLQGYENYLVSGDFINLSFTNFMEQNQSQLLESSGTINLPVNLIQSSIIRPSSPIQILEAHSPSSRINISASKLKLNTEELNFYQLVKDYTYHKSSYFSKLSQLVPQGSSKLVAAKAFYNVLVLKAKGLIKLEQSKPYDEIDITPV